MTAVLCIVCQEAVALLKADARARGMPKRGGTYTSFDGKGGASTNVTLYDDRLGLLHRNREAFANLAHWRDGVAACESIVAQPPHRITANEDTIGVVFDLVHRHGQRPTLRQIQNVVDSHVMAWSNGYIEVVRESALVGLLPGVKRSTLGPGAELCVLTPRMLTTFWNEDAASFSLSGQHHAQFRVLSGRYLLTVRVNVARDAPSDMFTRSLDRSEIAVSALRLALVGSVGAAATRERFVPKPSFISGSIVQDPPPSLTTWTSAGDAVFDQSAARKAGALYRRLLLGVPTGFDMALRRFSQSFERRTAEDAIVDLTIALEATLLHGQNTELTYRIQVLGAALLRHEGSGVAPKLKQLYSVRSKIVHGASLLSDVVKNVQPNAFVNEMRSLVGTVLCAYLAKLAVGKSMDEVNRDLETGVITTLAR